MSAAAARFTRAELMTIAASRLLTSADVCFVGIGIPSTACNLARIMHAPGITLIYESGTIGARPDVLPLSIGDGQLCETSLTTVSVPEVFRYWLQGSRIGVGFLGAAQIDRFANLNTTVVGGYDHPSVRLPGAGGAPEVAAHCQRVFVVMPQTRRSFVETLDFTTTLGHGTGGQSRAQAGVPTQGPMVIITDLCVMEPEPLSKELRVTSLHPGVTFEQVQEQTAWPLLVSPGVTATPDPTDRELQILRDLQRRSQEARN